MRTYKLGRTGPTVSKLGLGCMGMSGSYGHADRAESIATVRAALDEGVNLFDTGDFYGTGHNELLLSEALTGVPRDSYVLSVKFGALRDPAGANLMHDLRPAAVKSALAYSLRRLKVDHIDIYRPARIDPAVPFEDTIGAISEMVQAGYVRHIGLSEVGADTIRHAAAIHPIVDLQIEYALLSRDPERHIFPVLRELGIAVTAYGVLSRGLISNGWRNDALEPGDWRLSGPRFQPGNIDHNLALVAALTRIAEAHGITVAQLAVAWVAAQHESIVPLIGTTKRSRLREAVEAIGTSLSEDELQAIERIVPRGAAKGDRYPSKSMALLDSERQR